MPTSLTERTPRKRNHDTRSEPPHNVERLIRMRELKTLVSLGPSTIYRLINEGRFPKPLHPFGNRIAAWRSTDVQQWIADRYAGKAA